MDGSDSSWWRDDRATSLAVVGVALIVSGAAHLVAWGVLGGPWEGPVTWRKPILFGISGGLTSLSLGWAFAKLPRRWGDSRLAAATAWALLVEIALIDLQRWRGVASHFNRQTRFDSLVYDVMGALILFVTAVIVDLAVRFLRQRTELASDMLLAARAGLVLLAVSCGLGIWAGMHGDIRTAAGLPPETFGAAGVTKFPHGIAIHAIQWLPLLAWSARRAGLDEKRRWWLVAASTVGTALVLGYALVQTLSGRSRFDALPVMTAILALGVACLALPVVVVAAAMIRARRRSPRGRPPRHA